MLVHASKLPIQIPERRVQALCYVYTCSHYLLLRAERLAAIGYDHLLINDKREN